jgi:hypothetical protein
MTQSTRNLLSRGSLATLLLAVAPFTFGGTHPLPAADEIATLGHIVVTAPRRNPNIRSIADLGTMTVTAQRDMLVADLGAMTVTANRDVVTADLGAMTVTAPRAEMLANLGAMTVTAPREIVLAGNVSARQVAF